MTMTAYEIYIVSRPSHGEAGRELSRVPLRPKTRKANWRRIRTDFISESGTYAPKLVSKLVLYSILLC